MSRSAKIPADLWLLVGTLLLLFLFYSETLQSFYNLFSHEGAGQSHAPLLLLVSIYLIYRAWAVDKQTVRIEFNLLFTLLMAGISLLWMATVLMFVEAGQQFFFILMLAFVVLALQGFNQGRRYLVPILILLTLLPVWNVLVPYLQLNSAFFTSVLLDLTGFTSTRDGYLLQIPNGTFEVADACSGLKFLVISITLALIHTQLVRVDFKTTVLYVVSAMALALISNIIRIYIIVIIGYVYGLDHELVHDHNHIGWGVFVVLVIPFLMLGERWLQKKRIPTNSHADTSGYIKHTFKYRLLSVMFVVFAFSLGPAFYSYFSSTESGELSDNLPLQNGIKGWEELSSSLGEWRPLWTNGDRVVEGRYRSDNDVVDLYTTQFLKQDDGYEAVNVRHRVYDIEKWSRIYRSAKPVSLGEAGSITVEETLLTSPGNKRRLVWQWYLTNGKIVQGNVATKLNNLVGIFRGDPAISVSVISTEIVRDEAHATEVLSSFVNSYLNL